MTPTTLTEWAQRWNVPAQAINELLALPVPGVRHEPDPAIASEAGVQAHLRITAPTMQCHLWRNNNGATQDENGRHLRYGLGNDSQKINKVFKSSDLIGITPVTWHGRLFGVFTAVEVKKPGWTKPTNERERAQLNFLNTITQCGGIATFATAADEYVQLVRQFRGE